MQALKDYLIDEFRDKAKNYVACEFKFVHSTKLKPDKASGVSLKIDVLKIVLRFVDRDLNTLHNCSVVFENNVIPKNKEKSFVNISPKELNNRFAFAKSEIVKSIMDEYIEKRDELNTKIEELKTYLGNASDVIAPKLKGETIKIADEDKSVNNAVKKVCKFDM